MGVRMRAAKISHMRNVLAGGFTFPCSLPGNDPFAFTSDVVGLYGQNGSGKTTFIRALDILKSLLMGVPLDPEIKNDMTIGYDNMELEFEFSIQDDDDQRFHVIYHAQIGQTYLNESVRASCLSVAKPRMNPVLASESADTKQIAAPLVKCQEFFGTNPKDLDELRVAKMLCAKEHRSFLFSKEVHLLMQKHAEKNILNGVFVALHNYGVDSLFVIDNRNSGLISLDVGLPFNFRMDDAFGNCAIPIDKPIVLPPDIYEMICKILDAINVVLKEIVPGVQVAFHVFGKELSETGKEGIRVQLVRPTVDNQTGEKIFLPLKYESEGIRKIISILHLLIVAYNNPDITLAIDELDSGIFEYLFGEILGIMQESGKGQLVFTSHNLRPLEVLKNTSIIYTTTNPSNRYIRRKNVKPSNNNRSCYFRDMTLGGEQSEELYNPTNSIEIAHAMRKAVNLKRNAAGGK